jgi:thiamine kinase-like enzyme
VAFLASSGLAMRRQHPAIDEPLRTFESDLAERLSGLPLPDDAESKPTDGLVPVHGDLTPWNLRRTPRGLVLFDWESAGWRAPGSDLALYRRSCDEIRRPWTRRQSVQ